MIVVMGKLQAKDLIHKIVFLSSPLEHQQHKHFRFCNAFNKQQKQLFYTKDNFLCACVTLPITEMENE